MGGLWQVHRRAGSDLPLRLSGWLLGPLGTNHSEQILPRHRHADLRMRAKSALRRSAPSVSAAIPSTLARNGVRTTAFTASEDRVRIHSVSEVTRILNAIQKGDPKAAGELLPAVYEELRRLAAHKMARESS